MIQALPRFAATPIGGFFEWRPPAANPGGRSILDAWTGGRPYAAFVNARSAFAALAGTLPKAALWLPAFLCRDLISPGLAHRVRFYPVLDGFEPDLAAIEAGAKSGDVILLVAYFGRPLSDAARAFAAARRDLHVCEDRAQALDAGDGLNRGWRLYSPRKLLGVADGGLLVAQDETAPPQPSGTADASSLWAAPRLRAANPAGAADGAWHAANQAKEAAMTACMDAITPESLEILERTAIAPLAAARLANWRRLDQRLREWTATPRGCGEAPLGYVLRMDSRVRDRVRSGLIERLIFPAVHWSEIAGDPRAFPREAEWSRQLLTLPCDHRYGAAEMDRVAEAVLELLE